MNFILQGFSLLASHPIRRVTGGVLIEGKMSVPKARKKNNKKTKEDLNLSQFFDSSEAHSILATKPNVL